MSWLEPDSATASSSPPPTPPSRTRLKRHHPEPPARETSQLRRLTTLDVSVSRATNAIDQRPSPPTYIGTSNARRLLKRATLCKAENDTPIFAMHDEAHPPTHPAAPFDDHQPARGHVALGYTVHCYATHAEDEQKRKAAATVAEEKRALLASLNASRRGEGSDAVPGSPDLTLAAQAHADEPRDAERDELVEVLALPRAGGGWARAARLESPPGMGALAAAEMWYGGKYRRHFFGGVHAHRADCPCRLRLAFETLVDPAWTAVGVGRSEDGRWVVVLAE